MSITLKTSKEEGGVMSIWSLDIGWFALGVCLVLGVVIISMERICYTDDNKEANDEK